MATPTSTCNTVGYNPHVNPLLLLDWAAVGATSQVNMQYNNNGGSDHGSKTVLVSTPSENPNVNFYKVAIVDNASNKVCGSYKLDLNLHVSNASTTSALDTPNTNMLSLEPIDFLWGHGMENEASNLKRLLRCKACG